MYTAYLLVQLGEQLPGDSIARSGTIQTEDADATAVGCGYASDVNDGLGSGGVGAVLELADDDADLGAEEERHGG